MYKLTIILVFLLILSDLYLCFDSRKSSWLFVFNLFIAISNLSILQYYYILQNKHILDNIGTTGISYESPMYYFLFKSLLCLSLYQLVRIYYNHKLKKLKIVTPQFSNRHVFFVMLSLILLAMIFGIRDSDVNEFRYISRISAPFEYARIAFIFLFATSQKNKKLKYLSICIAALYCFEDLYFGGRISTVQVLLLTFLYYFREIRPLQITLLGLIGFGILTVTGILREFGTINLETLQNLSGLDPETVINNLSTFSTATWSYLASISHIYTIEFIDLIDRSSSFLYGITNIFLGDTVYNFLFPGGQIGNLTSYANKFHTNLGGGLIFTHYFFWGGYLGLILFSILQHELFYKSGKSKSTFSTIVFIIMFIGMPRWYLYGPHTLLRAVIIVVPIFFVFYKVVNSIKLLPK